MEDVHCVVFIITYFMSGILSLLDRRLFDCGGCEVLPTECHFVPCHYRVCLFDLQNRNNLLWNISGCRGLRFKLLNWFIWVKHWIMFIFFIYELILNCKVVEFNSFEISFVRCNKHFRVFADLKNALYLLPLQSEKWSHVLYFSGWFCKTLRSLF